MKQFTLSKSTTASHSALTRFNVFNAVGDIIGSINVPPEEEAYCSRTGVTAPRQPRAIAGKNSAVAAMVAAAKRLGAASPRYYAGKENSAVAAMLEAAKKHGPASREAILRGCCRERL